MYTPLTEAVFVELRVSGFVVCGPMARVRICWALRFNHEEGAILFSLLRCWEVANGAVDTGADRTDSKITM